MKRILKTALKLLAVILLLGIAWLVFQFTHPPELKPYAHLAMPAATAPIEAPDGLRVTFLGVATLLIDDGETAILTDGFFTRPDRTTVLVGRVAPDPALIASTLQRAGIHHLAAVIVSHSHYDHALDAPEVAKQTGALLVGSGSTANIGRGWGLPEQKIRVVHGGEQLDFGRFHVQLIKSRHAPTGFTGGEIDVPLAPPARATDYKEGDSYSILVQHGQRSLMVQSSAGFVEGALQGKHADVIFLGVGTLGMQGESFRNAYWQQVVRAVGARRIFPIHWDDFTRPLTQDLVALPYPFDDFSTSMDFIIKSGARDNVQIRTAPALVRIDPFAGL
ncbi:MBL fold metallo-hydrolase [Undibacterium sp.]|uniref:MBL fold metallo-hydrolase n=1 Tax=Undibacterium sp. TaxID=1914977 RepID=UPI00374D7BA2